jgi:Na+-driven multidrug efflux pump
MRDKRDLIVEGNLRRAILTLAGPAVGSMLLQSMFNIVDMIWVGRLGPPALAALSTGGFLIWSVFAITHMISVGINSMTARYVGAKLYDEARYVAGEGLVLGLVISVLVMFLGLVGSESVFGVMGTAPDVTRLGLDYLRIIFLGIPTVILFFAMNSVYRGFGDTRTPMLILFVSVVSNIVLDPFLIFGWGPFPRLEIEGAALATVISRGLGLVIGIGILLKRRMIAIRLPDRSSRLEAGGIGSRDLQKEAGIALQLKGGLFDLRLFWRMIGIGAPPSISGFLFCIVYILLTRVTTDFGTESVAALGIGHKAESVSYMSSIGFAIAAATIVGQNLGAGRPDRAARGAWLSLLYLSGITLFCSLMFVMIPDGIVGLFNKNSLVMEAGRNYLMILSISQLFMGAEIVMDGAFSGAGDTVPPMVVSTPLSIARIPAAYWFSYGLGLGVSGVWWSISLTSILKGILISLWFLRGKWKTKVI